MNKYSIPAASYGFMMTDSRREELDKYYNLAILRANATNYPEMESIKNTDSTSR